MATLLKAIRLFILLCFEFYLKKMVPDVLTKVVNFLLSQIYKANVSKILPYYPYFFFSICPTFSLLFYKKYPYFFPTFLHKGTRKPDITFLLYYYIVSKIYRKALSFSKTCLLDYMSCDARKLFFGNSDTVQHKLTSTVPEEC